MYRVASYYCGKVIAELPLNILVPILFMLISYFLVGLNDAAQNIFTAFGIFILAYNTAGAFSLMMSTMIKNKEVAVSLLPILIVPFMLFSGFFVN